MDVERLVNNAKLEGLEQMKAIVIVMDTVNRSFLNAYGNEWVQMPNLKRLQEHCAIFDSHWVASAPCMPARRDMLTGRLNFLERNWGPIEPFDETLPEILRRNGIFTHMVTDHYHYLETGGENYCQAFDTWECFRGQENDPWVSRVNRKEAPEHYGKYSLQYEQNGKRFVREEDRPGPQTFNAAVDWLEENRDVDNYMLWVEPFDPHEPFDIPEEYLEMYHDNYSGPLYNWPNYKPVDVPQEAVEHVRKRYAALLTMTDWWLGKLLNKMDELELWKDTMVVFTTDHGYLLGEHGFMAKNYMPAYNEIMHIPLMIHLPEGKYAGKRIQALTQNIDLLPTVLEHFGINPSEVSNPIHGKSWLPLLEGHVDKIRDCAIYGYFAKSVNVTDGKYTYFRAAANEDNQPINLYASVPSTLRQYYSSSYLKDVEKVEIGRFLPWTRYPVYKIPGDIIQLKDQSQAFNRRSSFNSESLLFNLETDYGQENPLKDPSLEQVMMNKLKNCMKEHDSPEEQYVRLGL